jgi:hypothetical protein
MTNSFALFTNENAAVSTEVASFGENSVTNFENFTGFR